MLERIGAGDRRLEIYEGLRDPDLVRREGLFVAEGRLVLERVITDRRYRIRSILLSDAAAHQLSAALAQVDPEVPVYVCSRADFLPITGFNIHRGCLALVERPAPRDLVSLIATARTVVVLEAVANPDNVGGVFRNAAAFGADAIVLTRTCADPLYRKAIRTSMAATLRVPFAHADAWPDALADIRSAGFTVAALSPRGAVDMEAFLAIGRPRRVALVVGAEGTGLSDAVEPLADATVRIPILPDVDSLNLATAAGIALYRLRTRDNDTSPVSV